MKKAIHLLLSMMLVFSFIPASVLAETESTEETPTSPGTTDVEQPLDIQLQNPEYIDGQVKLKWRVKYEESANENAELFTLVKNGERSVLASQPEMSQEQAGEDGVYRIYELIDSEVKPGDTVTYSIAQGKAQSNETTLTVEMPVVEEEASEESPKEDKTVVEEEEQVADEEAAVKDETVPSLNIVAHKITDTTADISWSLVDVDEFRLYVDGNLKEVVSPNKTTYALTKLAPATTYKVKVEGVQKGSVVSSAEVEVTTSAVPTGEVIPFEDSTLEQAIKDELGLKRAIYQADLDRLTSLSISNLWVTSIEGLQFATNLETLHLGYNDIADLTPIKALTKLKDLDVTGLAIKDTSIFSKSLVELNISHTSLANLDFLKKLTNLQTVYAYGLPWIGENAGAQAVLKDLTAKGVTVYSNEADDVNMMVERGFVNESSIQVYWSYWPEANFNLYPDHYIVSIDGKETKVSGLEEHVFKNLKADTTYNIVIKAYDGKQLIGRATMDVKTAKLPEGKKVSIKDKGLRDMIKMTLGISRDIYESDMKNLTSLYVDYEGVRNLAGLELATNLEELSITGNPVSDLTAIKGLSKLSVLFIDDTKAKDLKPLSGLTNLNMLVASYNPGLDLSPIQGLPNLQSLSADSNGYKKLPVLPSSLIELSLYDNELTSLKGIEKAANLQYLIVSDNPISDFKSLAKLQLLFLLADYTNMTNLDWLNSENAHVLQGLIISGNAITDITPLKNGNNLLFLAMDETAITDISPLLDLPYLAIVSFISVPTLDISEGSKAMEVIKELRMRGVEVFYEEEMGNLSFTSLTATHDSIYAEWEYIGEEEVADYELYIDGELVDTVPGTESSYVFTGLSPGTPYEVAIAALNADGEEIEIYFDYVFTISEDLYFTKVEATEDSIETEWIYDGEGAVYEYEISLNGEEYEVVDADTLSHIWTELEKDTTYTIELMAYDEEYEILGYTYAEATTTVDEDGTGEGNTPPPPTKKPDPGNGNKKPTDGKTPSDVIKGKKEQMKSGAKPEEKTGKSLPNTSTNSYNYLAMGMTILLAGTIMLFLARKKHPSVK
ncbi:fibronectin type III domain-containing protein [Cytobacillus sp. FSL R7-0680]|uniref:fibronectin type III domain-containing protein n=1 Tax=Cytobacillus sp. FSL R7-0680 TaxID=2921689 RepID=UPI0030FBFFF3